LDYPKRLIEVDLPIRRISAHARREKAIRQGHLSSLHIWWARRPLAACRAVICASLWPDPVDAACPKSFREVARRQMQEWANGHLELTSVVSMRRFNHVKNNTEALANNLELRRAVLDFLADFADWENSTHPAYLATARELTRAAHEAMGGDATAKPLVVDPFAGGGAIPLESLRIGADAFASDLNPIPVLLNKAALEYIPRFGAKLADGVRQWGTWIKENAEKKLSELYPRPNDGTAPMTYLWARTIRCEGPGCGADVPMMRGLSLAKKGSKSVVLEMLPKPRSKKTVFRILRNDGGSWFDQEDPKHRVPKPSTNGTVQRGSVSCPCCGYTTPVAHVREQLRRVSGGARTATLVAVVSVKAGQPGRLYRLPTRADLDAVERANTAVEEYISSGRVPTDTLPLMSGVFNAPLYGHTTWASLFNSRQLLAMMTLADLVSRVGTEIGKQGGDPVYAEAVQTCLFFLFPPQNGLIKKIFFALGARPRSPHGPCLDARLSGWSGITQRRSP